MVHVQSERGQGRAPFRLPSDAATWRQIDRSERSAGGRHLVAQGKAEEGKPRDQREIGEELFAALFPGEVLRLYERCLDQIERDPDLGLRIKLAIDPHEPQVAPLQALPWELMRQPGTPEFLALSRRRLFVRYLAPPRPVEPMPRPPRLRLLCVAASPAGWPPLALDRELRNLREAIGESGGIEIVQPESPTLEGIRRALLEQECHILHFMGHGDFAAEGGVLCLESLDGRGDLIRGEDLANKLSDIPSLRLAVLNACNSGQSGRGGTDPFAGVAGSLVLGGLPAVVAMRAPISDRAAIVFSQTFYRRLVVGDPVDLALTEARQAVHSMHPGSFEWATPVAFLRIPDGCLFTPDPVDAGEEIPSSEPGGQGAAKRWYQSPKIAIVLAALIGLTATVMTIQHGSAPRPKEAVGRPTVPPDSGPVISFPVIAIDDGTGDPIAGAQVMADQQGISVETDSQGRCTLNIRPGQTKLRITLSRPGYQTRNVELTVFEGMDAARFRLRRREE